MKLPTLVFLVALLFGLLAQAQEFTSPPLDAVTSWIGNSYGGGKKWVQQDIAAMAVMPDGTVFTNVYWEEAGGNAGEYRDGEVIRYAMHTHGWGNGGGQAVAANSRYVYLAVQMENEGGGLQDPDTWPPKGSQWQGVSRRQRADFSKSAPFIAGKGGKGDTLKGAFLPVAEIPEQVHEQIPGICADETTLYVADPHASEIKVFDAETMQPLRKWKVHRAGPLALDRAGMLWMLESKIGSESARFVRFNAAGEEQAPAFTFPADVAPVAFCLAQDERVFVADDGAAQQVRIYSSKGAGLEEVGRFGVPGGIASGVPGAFGDRKLNHVTALGLDAHDNLYVAHDGQSGGGGTVLESWRLADGALNWRLFGLTFVDDAEIDDASDGDVFTKEEHFRLDYSKPAGHEWNYAGYTIGSLKYPEDPRLHLWSAGAWVRRIGGRRVLFVNDMDGAWLQVFRFAPETDGEVAIPSGFFAKDHLKTKDGWPPNQPATGEWIWRDANGDGRFGPEEYSGHDTDAPRAQGWWVDRAGGVWMATETEGIRYFPSQGLDPRGNPQWGFPTMRTFPHPDGFREVKRLRYDAASDTMYLGGTTDQDRNQHWKPMGPVVARYDGWLRGSKTLRWRVTLPYAHGSHGHESCEPMGFDVAGDLLFVPYTGASEQDGVRTGRVEVFRAGDGSSMGHLEPGEAVGEVGLQDIRECLTAHRRSDGEYVVLLEDDYRSKVVMYRLQNMAPRSTEATAGQAQAIAEIEKRGGKVFVDEADPDKPVTRVVWTVPKVTDDDLALLEGFTRLQSLDLVLTGVTDAGLEHLRGLVQLEQLSLGFTKITDAGLPTLAGLTRLRKLDVRRTRLTDAAFTRLKGMTQLQDLGFEGTHVADGGLKDLARFPSLRQLILDHTLVTDDGLATLAGFAQLTALDLGGDKITDAGLQKLAGLVHMQWLSVHGIKIGDEGLGACKGWSDLRYLDVGATQVTDAGLEIVDGLPLIENLNIGKTAVTTAGLAHVKGLTRLQYLDADGLPITDGALEQLKGLSALKQVDLRKTKVSETGVAELQQALPPCKILRSSP